MAKPDGGPAFPSRETWQEWNERTVGYVERSTPVPGMSLRDYFAAHALAGIAARGPREHESAEARARYAYGYADAMLAERDKE
jgi:hypothetical protein